jgi:cell pole-organizing protein PopZ
MSGTRSQRGGPTKPAPPADADPSMEDILASIRRILNEGDGEDAAAEILAQPAPQAAQAASVMDSKPIESEDVFILDPTMMVNDTASTAAADNEPPLVAADTAAAASQSMGALKRALSERNALIQRTGSLTLEDIVRDEVRPMIKNWLDTHLPPIVERLVRAEIQRVVEKEML